MRADDVALGWVRDSANDWPALLRGRCAPGDRIAAGRPVARMRGQPDVSGLISGHELPQKSKKPLPAGAEERLQKRNILHDLGGFKRQVTL